MPPLITINLLNVFTLLGEKQLEEFGVWIKEPTYITKIYFDISKKNIDNATNDL